MTKVKICGITNIKDAHDAIEFGADIIGLNFYESSPRYVDAETAEVIVSSLPANVAVWGVFVNAAVDVIKRTANSLRLASVQLHGDETPSFVQELKSVLPDNHIIKAFRVSPDFRPGNVLEYKTEATLLDAFSPENYGGTGDIFDWEIAVNTKKLFPDLYLSGGLTPENVSEAIRKVVPLGVDVCSSIEKAKGIKDTVKMQQFIAVSKKII